MEFFNALVDLSNAMAPYILFGLIFAGFLHELIPDTIVKNHLGNDSLLSVIKATVFGMPLPVCSCGVIPLATGVKKSGASNGATLSFLISTPITGIDSILATYGMFGWAFTIYRIVSSLVISIVAGVLSNVFVQKETTTKSDSAFSIRPKATTQPQTLSFATVQKPQNKEESCCASGGGCCEGKKEGNFLTRALSYAFGTLLKDIASPLLVGLVVGAIITVAVPQNLNEILKTYSWLSYLIVIAIAVPMYVCATASLPIAAGLILSGVSPGAAFVFLSAGPATNTVTIGVVRKMLGKTTLYIYLGVIVIGSILFGLGLDAVLGDVDVKTFVHVDEHAPWYAFASSIVLWGFVLYYIFQERFGKRSECSDGSCCNG